MGVSVELIEYHEEVYQALAGFVLECLGALVNVAMETDFGEVLKVSLDDLDEPLLHFVRGFDCWVEVELKEALEVLIGVVIELDGAVY